MSAQHLRHASCSAHLCARIFHACAAASAACTWAGAELTYRAAPSLNSALSRSDSRENDGDGVAGGHAMRRPYYLCRHLAYYAPLLLEERWKVLACASMVGWRQSCAAWKGVSGLPAQQTLPLAAAKAGEGRMLKARYLLCPCMQPSFRHRGRERHRAVAASADGISGTHRTMALPARIARKTCSLRFIAFSLASASALRLTPLAPPQHPRESGIRTRSHSAAALARRWTPASRRR